MEVDYYKKYLELKSTCKKHEKTILKLRDEIRERCQSYLLYTSRNKKAYSTLEDSKYSSKKDDEKSDVDEINVFEP